ncbi:MAG: hypothetical protein QHC90_09345 [Shinella sp.]|nr:hypothetical protein [Shinella sp.]
MADRVAFEAQQSDGRAVRFRIQAIGIRSGNLDLGQIFAVSEDVEIHYERRRKRLALAFRFNLDALGCAEACQLSKPFAAHDETSTRFRGVVALLAASIETALSIDRHELVADVRWRHSVTRIANFDDDIVRKRGQKNIQLRAAGGLRLRLCRGSDLPPRLDDTIERYA